jgi:hypothetical protein
MTEAVRDLTPGRLVSRLVRLTALCSAAIAFAAGVVIGGPVFPPTPAGDLDTVLTLVALGVAVPATSWICWRLWVRKARRRVVSAIWEGWP